MEARDVTQALAQALERRRPPEHGEAEIESLHHAQIDARQIQLVFDEPRTILEAAGVKVADESQINVTAGARARRPSAEAQRQAAAAARRRIIIIIIHYGNCDADIIIFY